MDKGGIKHSKERKGSVGDISEFLKKKREREDNKNEEDSMFRSSKIIVRSPKSMGERKEEDREGWKRELREELRKDIITRIKPLGEEIREDLREIKDGLAGQGEGIKKELEKIREEFGEREREWEEERREMRGSIENLERKLEKLIKEGKGRVGEGGKEGIGVAGGDELETKIKVIERKLERKERKDRRRNIVIRGVGMEKRDVRGGVEQILEKLGVDIKIESVKRVRIMTEGKTGMAVVTLGSIEQKRQVMENKKMLRGRDERIDDDLTWEERKVRWRLREIARKEEGEGRRVHMGNGGLQIDGKWWKWNEEEEVLKSERREVKGEGVGHRRERQGESRGGKMKGSY